MENLQQVLRTARILHVALLTSIPFYVVVGEYFGPSQPRELFPIQQGLVAVGLAEIGVLVLLRARMVRPAAEVLRTRPDDVAQLNRWRSGTVASFVLCEAVVLIGFALRMIGGALPQAVPFYGGGFVALLLLFPRNPATQ